MLSTAFRIATCSLAGASFVLTGVAQAQPKQKTPALSPLTVRFPSDPSVLNAKTDLGAKGDGIADDTDALQRGLDRSSGLDGKPTCVLFLPNGTYRVTRTLVAKNALGPWVYGETRDGVVIRLDDGAKDVTSVIRTHPRDGGETSADWFMRNLRNFTVDVGNNLGVDGIRWFATNTGILQNVRVRGNGKIGINAGFMGQSGPNLIQDCDVSGFETGVLSQWIWGETLSGVTVRDCRKVGLEISANAVGVENLTVINTPQAVFCDYPNDWTWWGGVVALVGGDFRGTASPQAAIRNRSILYARDVRVGGYKSAVQAESPDKNVVAMSRVDYQSHPTRTLEGTASGSLSFLPIKREPVVPWELDMKKWVCVNDFGAVAGDGKDDTEAFQKAIDAGARRKATVVYFRGVGGPDPNGYDIEGTVQVRGTVRHLLGLGFGRLLGGKDGRSGFVVGANSAPVVKFQSIDSFGGSPVTLTNASRTSKMLVESCGVIIIGDGAGEIYATDCSARVEMRRPGQSFWARQLNPEGDSDTGLVQNNGAKVWILGLKCEGRGVRVATGNAGRTEIYGAFLYSPDIAGDDRRPLFLNVEATTFLAGVREISFGHTFNLKWREIIGGKERTLDVLQEQGWLGWAACLSGPPTPRLSGSTDGVKP